MTDESITQLESVLGCWLPPAVAEVYRVHDGFGLPAFVDGVSQDVPFLSLRDSLEEHRFVCSALADPSLELPEVRASRGVKNSFWVQAWLPIATFGNGDKLFLDLAPEAGGNVGQVFEWSHEDLTLPIRHRSLVE